MNKTRKITLFIMATVLAWGCGFGYAASEVSQTAVVYGADANPTGEPLGGGVGYSKIILSGDYTVANKEQFLAALSAAKPGEVIYLEPEAEINLTGFISLEIPGGITIAGNRGYQGSPGPLIYTNQLDTYPYLLTILKQGVRITGIRLRGPSPYRPQSNGLNISADRTEIDNCEVYNWSNSGIQVMRADDVYIHHNFIHNVRRPGLGYPVVLNRATALIEANVFDYYRHAIAGTGYAGTGYEARYNLVKGNAISHAFDMHGGTDFCPRQAVPCTPQERIMAGSYLHIHHNTFLITSYQSIVIRGIPTENVDVHHNWFYNYPQDCVTYRNYSGGNVNVYENIYGDDKYYVEVLMTPGPIIKLP